MLGVKPPIPLAVMVGPYLIDVQIVPHSYIKKNLKLRPRDWVDGYWDNKLGDGRLAGRIFINSRLSHKMQWKTFLHELQHAVIDLHDWDWEN